MMEASNSSAKRKADSDDDEQPICKKSKPSYRQLLELSDDVLLLILSHLKTCDLLAVSETCLRLYRVASDESLWKIVNTIDAPLSPSKLWKVLKFLTAKTTSISLGGQINPPATSITPSILEKIAEKCTNLEEFAFDHCHLDAEIITISQLPSTVKKLSFRSCQVINISQKGSYLKQMVNILPILETLDLKNARWLSNHSLLAISNSQTLRSVNLSGCNRIGECMAYSALATRCGFRSLTWIDLRDTNVGDSEVPCFGSLPNLTHLYFGRNHEPETQDFPPDFESNGRITDKGVISMCLSALNSGRKNVLQVLTLVNTEITDRSLDKLASAYILQVLDVSGCKNITKDGIKNYVSKHPKCKLIL